MENSTFIDDCPIKNFIYMGFPIATCDCRRVHAMGYKKSKNVSRKSQGDETMFQPIRRCGKQKT